MSWRFFYVGFYLKSTLPSLFVPVKHCVMLEVCPGNNARSNNAEPEVLVHYNIFFGVGFEEYRCVGFVAHIEKRVHKPRYETASLALGAGCKVVQIPAFVANQAVFHPFGVVLVVEHSWPMADKPPTAAADVF